MSCAKREGAGRRRQPTAIEAATEIAEARPEPRVTLATTGELGGWLGPKARRHLLRAFDRFSDHGFFLPMTP